MRAQALIAIVTKAGGKLRVKRGQLWALHVPPVLDAQLSGIKNEIIRHLQSQAYPDYQGARYRWQQVCHDGECDQMLKTPRGKACSLCHPFANGTPKGRLVWIPKGSQCPASVHTNTAPEQDHILWRPLGWAEACRN